MSQIIILSTNEIDQFDKPPVFDYNERRKAFYLSPAVRQKLDSFKTPVNCVGFVLLQGYFRHSFKFFQPNDFHLSDIKYVISNLGYSIEPREIKNAYVSSLKSHRPIILDFLGYRSFSVAQKEGAFSEVIKELVWKRISVKKIFFHTCEWLKDHRFEIPSYHAIQSTITDELNLFEKSISYSIGQVITEEQKELLDELLKEDEVSTDDEENGIEQNNVPRINKYKKSIHSLRPAKMKIALGQFRDMKFFYQQMSSILQSVNLPQTVILYYATWTLKARTNQLLGLTDPYNKYLHLLSFVCHQYYQRQDYLIDMLLLSVQTVRHSATREEKEKYYLGKRNRNLAIKALLKSRSGLKEKWEKTKNIVFMESVSPEEKIETLQKLIESDHGEDERLMKIKELEKELEGPDNATYYEGLASKYIQLKNRVSGILKETEFNNTSDPKLLEAILYYQTEGATSRYEPISFLTTEEQDLLFDKEGKFNTPLYRTLLYLYVADGIKSGILNLKYSYKYLSLEDYLIDKDKWKDERDIFLKRAGFEPFSDKQLYIDSIGKMLTSQYTSTNDRITASLNQFIRFSKNGEPIVTTPAIEKPDLLKVSSLFASANYTSLLKILLDISEMTGYLDCFEHFTVKDAKRRPNAQIFYAGIVGYGCNIGIEKMGSISKGLSVYTLENTVNWYFTLDNLISANDRVVSYIDSLPLAKLFKRYSDGLHTSSDGQKFGISVDSLNANYSYKYFGHGRGVSVNSFISEHFAVFYSNVISSSEREAAYVIDGLMHNDVIKSSIHSTDTHGYSEIVFGITHLLGISFAPRIQDFKDQLLYSFEPVSIFSDLDYKIVPDRQIDTQLILDHWEDILRFVASIKLRNVTASQLLKRLSSYSRQHPLYKALKEFGKIHKTVFLLRYMDEEAFRSRIEKQLNKVELSHKFAKAIAFGSNQEFSQETKEGQEIVAACRRLIQNSIILWNYFFLSELIASEEATEKKKEILEIIGNGSILTWQHINLHGEYDFDKLDKNLLLFNIDRILGIDIDIE